MKKLFCSFVIIISDVSDCIGNHYLYLGFNYLYFFSFFKIFLCSILINYHLVIFIISGSDNFVWFFHCSFICRLPLTSFLPGDLSTIVVLRHRRMPFASHHTLQRNGRAIVVCVPQLSSLREFVSVAIIPGIDLNTKYNVAHQEHD